MIFYEDYYITFHINKYVVVYIEIENIPIFKKIVHTLYRLFFIYVSMAYDSNHQNTLPLSFLC